jgi:hypothetical protein
MRISDRFSWTLLCLVCVFMCSSCVTDTVGQAVNVSMYNGSDEEVHMWATGETMGPKNKLAPGKQRVHKIIIEEAADKVSFAVSVGRNGLMIKQRTFIVDIDPDDASYGISVVFDGSELSKSAE